MQILSDLFMSSIWISWDTPFLPVNVCYYSHFLVLFFQCGYTFCFDCKESWHIGMTCKEYKEVISDSASGVRWAIEIKNSDILLLICTLHKFANLCFTSYYEHFVHQKVSKFSDSKDPFHAFVTSQLDNKNFLLYGLPRTYYSVCNMFWILQLGITMSRKSDYVTPLLFQLHLLPVEQCIEF